ncbi:MAG TPA: aspartate aminotransferase family protein [Candidatus Binataceae bacterium]|nr:aspartate aminotransferase family protein [Candidatus Binataceae bacterium]
MNSAEIVDLAHANLINTYGCMPLAFDHGNGVYLYDSDGNRYLDFFCGLAVTSLGHAHPRIVGAIKAQADKLTHACNVFHTEPMAKLAARIGHAFGDGRVFFCNSGAEANEAALKLARRWGHGNGGKFEFIATQGSFHGRTFATLSATGQEKYHVGFMPLVPGFKLVPYDDVAAIEGAITNQTVGVIVEPIQGEGGVVTPKPDYLARLREVCDRAKILLIVDEVQTGMGRTGKLFGYQHSGIKPDVITLAKALGGGVPIGAMVAKAEIASALTPGTHGSTFGGNPIACAAALGVFDALEQDGAIANAAEVGGYLISRLREIAKDCPNVREVRGAGMIIGVVLNHPVKAVVDACYAERLVVNGTADNVLRLLPPLILTRAEADAGLAIIERALRAAAKAS